MTFKLRKNSDEMLAKGIKNGDTQATAELYSRYKIYSWQISHEVYSLSPHNGFTLEDIFSVAFSSVAIAVKKFDASKGKALYPYWKTIAEHEIVEFIKRHSYSGGARAFAGISLDESYDDESYPNEEMYGLEEPDESPRTVFDEMFAIIFDKKNKFTPREQQILMCLLDGYEMEEICEILGITKSTFRYHLANGSVRLKSILIKRSE